VIFAENISIFFLAFWLSSPAAKAAATAAVAEVKVTKRVPTAVVKFAAAVAIQLLLLLQWAQPRWPQQCSYFFFIQCFFCIS